MPTPASPPWPPPGTPAPIPARTARRSWSNVAKWKRRSVYVAVVLIGLGAIVSATAEQDETAVVDAIATTSPLPSLVATTPPTTIAAPSTPTAVPDAVPTLTDPPP